MFRYGPVSISRPHPLTPLPDFDADIGPVQLLGKSNMVGLVGGGPNPKFPPNKFILWDDGRNRVALELSLLTPVRGVQLSKLHIIIVLHTSVRMYKFASPPSLIHAWETAANPWGLCCMHPDRIAFPGPTVGQVLIVEHESGKVNIIPAHTTALRAMALSRDGALLATASETVRVSTPSHCSSPPPPPNTRAQGTIVRVFETATCRRLVELRRGVDWAAIYSLAFSPSGAQLALTSDKGTLHVFDVPKETSTPTNNATNTSSTTPSTTNSSSGQSPAPANANEGKGKWGFLSRIPLMPRLFSDTYSFASHAFYSSGEAPPSGAPLGAAAGAGGGMPTKEMSSLSMSRTGSHDGNMRPPTATAGGGGNNSSGTVRTGSALRPARGVLGWLDEKSLVVVSGGADPRWERFVIVCTPVLEQGQQQDGGLAPAGHQGDAEGDGAGGMVSKVRRSLVREGWKRFYPAVN